MTAVKGGHQMNDLNVWEKKNKQTDQRNGERKTNRQRNGKIKTNRQRNGDRNTNSQRNGERNTNWKETLRNKERKAT